MCFIELYVDVLLIASSTGEEMKEFLKKTYERKELDLVDKFLGMNIKQTENEISIFLEDYIIKKAKEYNFTEIFLVYNTLH